MSGRIIGDELEIAKANWHPEQHVNVYDTLLEIFLYNADLKDISEDQIKPTDFAEPVDEDGQPCEPRLKEPSEIEQGELLEQKIIHKYNLNKIEQYYLFQKPEGTIQSRLDEIIQARQSSWEMAIKNLVVI